MPTDINTITAWCVVISTIVTALTGFFIVQTFQLQAKASLEQSKITKLEIERSFMEKRPLFFAKIVDAQEAAPKQWSTSSFELKLLRNDVYNFSFSLEKSKSLEKIKHQIDHDLFDSEGIIEETISVIDVKIDRIQLKSLLDSGEKDNLFQINLILEYQDTLGYEYSQKISITHNYVPMSYPPVIPKLRETFKKLNT
ncbi:hypothetical protein WAE58_21680 [Pedobacter panaciterrae]|uniref:Uncharacterized protein n=1 Tax=Pedobacter panaciterrae TaxID=363849 RepID=A0ABU8NTY1_9SPHI